MLQLVRSKTRIRHAIINTRSTLIKNIHSSAQSRSHQCAASLIGHTNSSGVVRTFSNQRFQYNSGKRSNEFLPVAAAAALTTILVKENQKSVCDNNPAVELSKEEQLERERKGDFSHLHDEWDAFMHSTIYGDEDDDDDDDDEDDDEDEEGSSENEAEVEEKDNEERSSQSKEPKLESNVDDLSIFEQEPDYSLLPAKDEPTTCSICLINRQGPCRDPWRWFEKCMKASSPPSSHDDEDNEDENTTINSNSGFNACMKASMTWMECVNEHRALYSYFTNQHFQPELDRMEQDIKAEDRVPNFPDDMQPSLDLVSFHEFIDVKDAMMEDSDELENLMDTPASNLIQQESMENTDESTPSANSAKSDPPEHLIPSYAKIELKDKNTDYPIELGYIKDQNGTLLGFDYFSAEKKENSPTGDMTFHLTPETKSVSIYALYRQPQKEQSMDTQNVDTKNNISSDIGEGDALENKGDKKEAADDSAMKQTEIKPKFKQTLYFTVLDVTKELELTSDKE